MESQDPDVEAEVEAARAEAAAIGGVAGDENLDPAERPVLEGGGGVAEGFEQAEDALVEHASHGDEYSGRAALHDAFRSEESGVTAEDAEADDMHTSEQEPGAEEWRGAEGDR
jgi:hypothetical protein